MNDNSLKFGDLVMQEYVIADLEASTKEEALTKMAEYLVEKGNCKPTFVNGILQREQIHPSALPMPGPKIAIPHTDAEHVIQSVILFARLTEPVEFRSMGSPDEKLQVRMISMFALKEKKRIGDMLEALINVYQREEILNAILGASGSEEIFTILHDAVIEFGQ